MMQVWEIWKLRRAFQVLRLNELSFKPSNPLEPFEQVQLSNKSHEMETQSARKKKGKHYCIPCQRMQPFLFPDITRILKKASDFLAFSSKLGHMEDLQQAFPISAQSPEFENDFLLYCNITMHVTHQSSCDH